jgi:hypothetical protein
MADKPKTEIVCEFIPRTRCYFGRGGSWTWICPKNKAIEKDLNSLVKFPRAYYENAYRASAELMAEDLQVIYFKVLGFADEVPEEVEETENSDEDSGTE